jgi:hypothetical protein
MASSSTLSGTLTLCAHVPRPCDGRAEDRTGGRPAKLDAELEDLALDIARFVRATAPAWAAPSLRDGGTPESQERFDSLALSTLRSQAERVAPYRSLLRARGCAVERLSRWWEAPAVPAAAFKTTKLCAAPARVVFRSSGTTRGAERRSTHSHPFPDLYRLIVDGSFPAACLDTPPGAGSKPDMLSLVPPRAVRNDSSLSFMVDHVLQSFGGPRSAWAMGRRGLDECRALRWLERAAAGGAPVLLLATALALDDLLRALERARERLVLPAGSLLFETGGFKGRRREVSRVELVARVGDRLGLPAGRVVREYGMTELTSQAYTRALHGGDPEVFFLPPWARAHVVDPVTLEELHPGKVGMLRIFDLGNVGSAAFVLTEDLARAEPGGGFRLAGRAAGADLRGCSLVAEELAEGALGRPD